MSTETPQPQTVTVIAEESENLDTVCYRGSAPLRELTVISQADVFDQVANPDGLQRDLSKKHAAEAYDYVARPASKEFPRAYPEVMLNVRDRKVVKVEPLDGHELPIKLVRITFDLDKIMNAKTVKVSRVDGNHRLFYGAGDGTDKRQPLDAKIPFSITLGLSREQEGSLFLDVNSEQKGLNTSHLSVLRSKLTPDEIELTQHPERVFALRLANDELSPWNGLVHLGGSKAGSKEEGVTRPVSFTALSSGVRRIITKSQYIHDLTDHEAQYEMIRRYWQAVQLTWPEGFEKPAEFYITKNIGIQSLSALGGTVLDRAMGTGDIELDQIAGLLAPTKDVFNWHKDATRDGVTGMSGNRAALIVSGELVKKLPPLKKRG
jgi:DGQHR domain-containing protein